MVDSDFLNLTENERTAKNCFIHLLTQGLTQECDETRNYKMELPSWYDEEKFKRGQKYFHDNSIGILTSGLYGLVALLYEPVTAEIFDYTEKPVPLKATRKRYIVTIKNIFLWYNGELKPGSEFWKSLEKVRHIHFMTRKKHKKPNVTILNQRDIVFTSYAFMAFALSRHQLFGINNNNREDCEGFIFYWAVISFIFGVKDELNMCLNSLEVVCLVCDMLRWQLFIPCCQLTTPKYVKLSKEIHKALGDILVLYDYETLIFMIKRMMGLPGYQYKVDLSKETFSRQIFTTKETKMLQNFYCQLDKRYKFATNFLFENDMRLLRIQTAEKFKEKMDTTSSEIHRMLSLTDSDRVTVSTIPNQEWSSQWNDAEFDKLTMTQKVRVSFIIFVEKYSCTWLGKLILKVGMKYIMYILESEK